jgi:hypothetical protein
VRMCVCARGGSPLIYAQRRGEGNEPGRC